MALTDARAKPRPLSATTRMFACELLGFLQFEKNIEVLFVREFFFEVDASPFCVKMKMPLNLTVGGEPSAIFRPFGVRAIL